MSIKDFFKSAYLKALAETRKEMSEKYPNVNFDNIFRTIFWRKDETKNVDMIDKWVELKRSSNFDNIVAEVEAEIAKERENESDYVKQFRKHLKDKVGDYATPPNEDTMTAAFKEANKDLRSKLADPEMLKPLLQHPRDNPTEEINESSSGQGTVQGLNKELEAALADSDNLLKRIRGKTAFHDRSNFWREEVHYRNFKADIKTFAILPWKEGKGFYALSLREKSYKGKEETAVVLLPHSELLAFLAVLEEYNPLPGQYLWTTINKGVSVTRGSSTRTIRANVSLVSKDGHLVYEITPKRDSETSFDEMSISFEGDPVVNQSLVYREAKRKAWIKLMTAMVTQHYLNSF